MSGRETEHSQQHERQTANPYAPPSPTDAAALAVDDEQIAGGEQHPPLVRDPSFWGFTATQFLGAFNDNLYKQLALLLFVAVPVGPEGKKTDLQVVALLAFSLPFILFSGFAGYLSDRWSKSRIIVGCKLAEVLIMLLGVGGFLLLAERGLSAVTVAAISFVLFLMGSHSAMFGPSKYGVLPSLFAARELPRVNGVVIMTTFLAIIFGSSLAGLLMDSWGDRLWLTGVTGMAIAGLGVATALCVRRLKPALPELKFNVDALFIPREIRDVLRADRSLGAALLVSTIFWLSAAIVQPAVNALGKLQLAVDNTRTSLLVAVISAGIAGGSVIAGLMSRSQVDRRVQNLGAIGMTVTLLVLAIPFGPQRHLLGYNGSVVALIALGGFTGMFAVPLQVFIQSRPPEALKGRTIATQNLLNWIGIFLSTPIYGVGNYLLTVVGMPPNGMFALTAFLMLPVAIWYRAR